MPPTSSSTSSTTVTCAGARSSFTTNKSPLAAWGGVLHDHDLAEAIVDRTLERGRLLVLDGPSVRTPHLDSPADPANSRPDKISGKDRTKFPEPPGAGFREALHRFLNVGIQRFRTTDFTEFTDEKACIREIRGPLGFVLRDALRGCAELS
jgi:hypothetical protein